MKKSLPEKPAIESFTPTSRADWRAWLKKNHVKMDSVWLVYYKKTSGINSLTWSEAVDEALCFGWIDSTAKSIDEKTYKQFFTKRKPKSVWSKINKDKIERLIQEGLMTKAGLVLIEKAKENGTWATLDEVDAMVVPNDLNEAFQKTPLAENYFSAFSNSDKKNILYWLVLAKRPETRQKRILEIVTLAAENKKPKIFWKK